MPTSARPTIPSHLVGSLNKGLLKAFQVERQRTDQIFSMADESAYMLAPIPLRHPLVFYDGHVDAFNWNVLFKQILGKPSFNPELDTLFARGIDPKSSAHAQTLQINQWPSRETIKTYKKEINQQLYDYLAQVDFSSVTHPLLKNGTLLYLLLEHELTHQETLLYMIHQLPHNQKKKRISPHSFKTTLAPTPSMQKLPAGKTYLGTTLGEFDFGWDNEFSGHLVSVDAFEMDTYPVTNGEFLAFLEAGGYEQKQWWTEKSWAWLQATQKTHPHYWTRSNNQWLYRGLFESVPLQPDCPVYVTHAEAEAYARYVDKALPTEAQWHRAAYGDNKQCYPWGNTPADSNHANAHYCHWGPVPVNATPENVSPFGVFDLCGNGWEWTSTPFMPFEGFEPSEGYPQYSADFFDGEHFVMKGGSYATHQRLLRRPFRNWFYWDYLYMYTTFRCVRTDG